MAVGFATLFGNVHIESSHLELGNTSDQGSRFKTWAVPLALPLFLALFSGLLVYVAKTHWETSPQPFVLVSLEIKSAVKPWARLIIMLLYITIIPNPPRLCQTSVALHAWEATIM
jgi:hypothetical protein